MCAYVRVFDVGGLAIMGDCWWFHSTLYLVSGHRGCIGSKAFSLDLLILEGLDLRQIKRRYIISTIADWAGLGCVQFHGYMLIGWSGNHRQGIHHLRRPRAKFKEGRDWYERKGRNAGRRGWLIAWIKPHSLPGDLGQWNPKPMFRHFGAETRCMCVRLNKYRAHSGAGRCTASPFSLFFSSGESCNGVLSGVRLACRNSIVNHFRKLWACFFFCFLSFFGYLGGGVTLQVRQPHGWETLLLAWFGHKMGVR